METNSQTYQGTSGSGKLLHSTQTSYSSFAPTSKLSPTTSVQALLLPHVVTQTTSTNLSANDTLGYDSGFVPATPVCTYGTGLSLTNCSLISDGTSYPYGMKTSTVSTGYSGATIKTELTPYYFQSNPTYLSANLLDLPAGDTIENGSGAQLSSTSLTYDQSGYVASSAYPLGHVTTTSNLSLIHI